MRGDICAAVSRHEGSRCAVDDMRDKIVPHLYGASHRMWLHLFTADFKRPICAEAPYQVLAQHFTGLTSVVLARAQEPVQQPDPSVHESAPLIWQTHSLFHSPFIFYVWARLRRKREEFL